MLEKVMDYFSPNVDALLKDLSNLPQIRCSWVDFMFPQGYGEQCRIYNDEGVWMIEFLGDRHGSVEAFFGDSDVRVAVQNGMRILQGISKYGAIRDLAANHKNWYRETEWPSILATFSTSEPDSAQ